MRGEGKQEEPVSELSELRAELAEVKRLLLIVAAARPQDADRHAHPGGIRPHDGIVTRPRTEPHECWQAPVGHADGGRVIIEEDPGRGDPNRMILRSLERFPDLDYSLVAKLLGARMT
jgi:hypothetical protein